jgi:hypothetical protein
LKVKWSLYREIETRTSKKVRGQLTGLIPRRYEIPNRTLKGMGAVERWRRLGRNRYDFMAEDVRIGTHDELRS